MKKSVLTIAAVLTFMVSAFAANDSKEASHNVSITIPTVALVDVEGGNVTLEPNVSALEAGNKIDFSSASNSDCWLNYTSVVLSGSGSGSNNRSITVSVEEDKLPEGLKLFVEAGNATNGKGDLGSAVGEKVEISETGAPVITEIGSCFTGNGTSNGHNLTYTLEMSDDDYANLVNTAYELKVVYTIVE